MGVTFYHFCHILLIRLSLAHSQGERIPQRGTTWDMGIRKVSLECVLTIPVAESICPWAT